MESLPGDVQVPSYPEPHRAPPELRPPDLGPLRLEKPVQLRLRLQQSAPGNLRRHMGRAITRVMVLMAADLAAFWLLRAALRAVRDHAALGARLAEEVGSLLPSGIVSGWQFAAALLVGLVVMGTYGAGDPRRNARRLFLACALAVALPLWMAIWSRGVGLVAVQYVLLVLVTWVGLVAERTLMDQAVERVWHGNRGAARALLVGPAEECRQAAAGPAFAPRGEFRTIGFVDMGLPPAPDALGHLVDFARLLHETKGETVVVCGYLSDGQFQDVVDASLAAGCEVYSVPRAIELASVQPTLVWRRGQPLIELRAPRFQGHQVVLKRLLDVVGAAAGLILLSPVLGALAVLVKLSSPGGVLFTQERVGQAGRRFRIFKFRTMVDGAEGKRDALLADSVYGDRRLFKVPNDPRVTRVGRWLRQTSLDELPQLINVLRGEMSLVGPRPPLPSEVDLYEAHHYARFDAKPGMTGPWQVAGRNEITDFERVVQLEREYIQNWSLGRDLAVLLRTIPAVVTRRGAH